jgi:hypothetical protein
MARRTGAVAVAALAALAVASAGATAPAPAAGGFTVVGSKVFDAAGQWVVFRGIGLTCTEYMQRPIFGPDFGWENCIVGPPPPYNKTAPPALNNETDFILSYLTPDTHGGTFPTAPGVVKVPFDAPFDEVIDPGAPQHRPALRVPVTASSYLYDAEANALGAAGYRAAIDAIVTRFTAAGVLVIIDHHESCTDGGLHCKDGGPMALRNFGNESGSLTFWDTVAAKYAGNPLVAFELYNEPHSIWFQAFYGGDPVYAGMAEMLDVVRRHGSNLAIIGGRDQYAQDAAGSVAFYLQYIRDHNGSAPSNVLYNLHPYQGVYQGETARRMQRLAKSAPTTSSCRRRRCPTASCLRGTPAPCCRRCRGRRWA